MNDFGIYGVVILIGVALIVGYRSWLEIKDMDKPDEHENIDKM